MRICSTLVLEVLLGIKLLHTTGRQKLEDREDGGIGANISIFTDIQAVLKTVSAYTV